MDMDFIDWLDQEMKKREMSQADLARKSGLSKQVISDYLNRKKKYPDPETLTAFAHGFSLSPIVLFRKAGLLPDTPTDQVRLDDWEYLLNQLPPDEQEEVRQIALMKIEKRQKAEAAARAANFKPKPQGR